MKNDRAGEKKGQSERIKEQKGNETKLKIEINSTSVLTDVTASY